VSISTRFKPYPETKDSGIEWLGKIPAHWDAVPIKRLARIVNGSTPRSSESEYWNGEIAWVTPDDLGQMSGSTLQGTSRHITEKGYASCGTAMVPPGSLILSTRAPIGHLAIAGREMCMNQGCRALVPSAGAPSKYRYYSLLAAKPVLQSRGQGSTFQELSRDTLGSTPIPNPLVNEQQAIAGFLDRETEKIDALVEKKEQLIELLQEKRTALITHAVTKGLDRNVPMKDSGIEWLGQIPAHWEVIRSQILFSLRKERARSDDRQLTASQEHGVIYQDEFMALEGRRVVQVVTGRDILKHVEPDDFVISMRSFQGGIEWSRERGSISSAYVMLVPSADVNPPYFSYLLKSRRYIQALQSTSNLVRDGQALRYENFRQVRLPLTSLAEQQAIADFLNRETAMIDALIAKVGEAIERLKEYRTALISAAVTGKLDVRGT